MKNKKFTDEDIIRFIYDEMVPHESEAFLVELCSDELLWERYEFLQETAGMAASVVYEPSEQSVQKVMDYVRETAPYIPQPTRADRFRDATRTFIAGKIPMAISLNAVIVVAFIFFVTVAIMGSAYQLTRGGIITPKGTLVQQVDDENTELYQWDDSAIEEELMQIRKSVDNLREDPVL
ncbi:MAG: hypothetical protein R3D00_24150 [Bacteroidia bacterium]